MIHKRDDLQQTEQQLLGTICTLAHNTDRSPIMKYTRTLLLEAKCHRFQLLAVGLIRE